MSLSCAKKMEKGRLAFGTPPAIFATVALNFFSWALRVFRSVSRAGELTSAVLPVNRARGRPAAANLPKTGNTVGCGETYAKPSANGQLPQDPDAN